MRAHLRSLLWPSAAVAVAIVAAAGWVLFQEPPPLQVRRLPDGTRLRLEAVTHGPTHHLVRGRYWQRLLAPLLTSRSSARAGATFCTFGTTGPATLVFWTTWNTNSPLTNWTRTVAFNERGEEVEVTERPFQSWLHTGEKLRGWVLPAFPRRGATAGLRIYVHGIPAPVAEFRVPNPTPGPYPVWTPTPVPVTRTDGDLAFTLTRLETGQVAPASVPPPYSRQHWTRALFRVRERGEPTDRWEPIRMTLTDATGNRIVPWRLLRDQAEGETRVAFCGNLPPGEAAWKLRAEFAPTCRFSPANLWRVRAVPVPGERGRSNFSAADGTRGARLRMTLERYGGGPGSFYLRLEVQASLRRDGSRLALIRAADDRGRAATIDLGPHLQFFGPGDETTDRVLEIIRPVGPMGHTLEALSWPQDSAYPLTVPEGAKTLDLTFAVVHSRFAEFVVRPARR